MSRFDLREVSVRREGHLIIDRVTATIAPGRCTALVGPSGAGKSTLLRLFNRLDDPSEGTVLLDGAPLDSLDVLALRRRVGLVGQRPVLVTESVPEELRVGAPDLADDQALALLKRVGLGEEFYDRPTHGLSGGEGQRVCLARTLAVGPQVLLLDEPTSALDPEAAAAVEDTLCGLLGDGLTAILVSHRAAQVRRMADDALVLRKGRLVESGPVAEVAYVSEGD
ncbi:putative ABC transport system ATP-binding protein [Catenulispora sp. GP43]|uniref:ABC transporter ATP-binding protein n=1 Tax=Catenulispora sp. GP43 TaxID=3156263 RepID=UPI003515DB23